MATCKDCLHFDVCEALEGNGIPKISPSQCGCFKNKADVVEVVRCKDCKSNPNLKTLTKGMLWCRKFRAEVHPTDFCSYGKRKDGAGK